MSLEKFVLPNIKNKKVCNNPKCNNIIEENDDYLEFLNDKLIHCCLNCRDYVISLCKNFYDGFTIVRRNKK